MREKFLNEKLARELIASVRSSADDLENIIDTHIYDDEQEAADSPEARQVEAMRELADRAEAVLNGGDRSRGK